MCNFVLLNVHLKQIEWLFDWINNMLIHDYNFKLDIRVRIMVRVNTLLGLWVGYGWRLHPIYPVK